MAVITQDAASDAEAPSRDWGRVLSSPWMLAVILLLAVAAYAPMLDDWFIGDDFWFLRGAQSSSFGDYALKSFDPRETSLDYEFNRYRPLYPIAWKLQYEVFGLHALPYHAVIIGLHLACVVLAWFVFRRLLGEGGLTNLATAIFALHPAYVDAIGWISGGNRVFAALPYIASLLLFMKYRDPEPQATEHESPITNLYYAGSLLLYVTAMLMHSSTITLVAVLVIYAAFVAGKPKDALRWRWWLPFAPFAAVAAGEALVQLYVRDHIGGEDGFTLGTHMFTNYGFFFGMLAVPVQTLVDTSTLESFAERLQVLAGFALIALTFAVAYRRPMWGLGVFAASWFTLALVPDSTYVLGTAGRLMYVPGFAGALLLVAIMLLLRDAIPASARRRAAVAAPYVVIIGVLSATAVSAGRSHGLTDLADRYEHYAASLQTDGPTVAPGGTLYLDGSPEQRRIAPASHLITLAQLYYGDINVVVVPDGQPTPPLNSGDAVFVYTP